MNGAELSGRVEILGYSYMTQCDILRCSEELTRWLGMLFQGVTRITDPGINIFECEESGRRAIGDAILRAVEGLWLPEEATEKARGTVSDDDLVRRFADGLHEVAYPVVEEADKLLSDVSEKVYYAALAARDAAGEGE